MDGKYFRQKGSKYKVLSLRNRKKANVARKSEKVRSRTRTETEYQRSGVRRPGPDHTGPRRPHSQVLRFYFNYNEQPLESFKWCSGRLKFLFLKNSLWLL